MYSAVKLLGLQETLEVLSTVQMLPDTLTGTSKASRCGDPFRREEFDPIRTQTSPVAAHQLRLTRVANCMCSLG